MIGIILAAGVGSRLRPLTNHKPKCLISTANKCILQYQLDAYLKAKVSDVVIVIGYEGEAIREYCKHIKNPRIHFVENHDYESTNNMYSLYLAREHFRDRGFILNNADLAISDDIVVKMLNSEYSDVIAVDMQVYIDESMKVSINNEGSINGISKAISEHDSVGCSIDFYKFSAHSSNILISEMEKIIERHGNVKDWTEVAMDNLFKSGELKFHPMPIDDSSWIEIDNFNDLSLADELFSGYRDRLKNYSLYCLDLDGTIYIGNSLIDGIASSVDTLKKEGKRVVFLSNNSSRDKEEYVVKLGRMGINCVENDIVLSTDLTVKFLIESNCFKVFVLGTVSLKNMLAEKGIIHTDVDPDFVVVGYDTELTYEKLVSASQLINTGVDFISTHCDLVCPTESGPIPDVGLIVDMLEKTTGKKVYKQFGKPMPQIIDFIGQKYDVKKEDIIVVGDRLYTDIKMASDAGVDSILVLSGETRREHVENTAVHPTYILKKFYYL